MPKPRLGIYIHIPFCASKCGYCDFYSLAGCDQQMPVYQKALIDHLLESSASIRNYEVDSIYFGGGTPSYYGAERILELFDVLKLNGNVRTDTEVTVECNPDSMNYKELLSLREEGVNRLRTPLADICLKKTYRNSVFRVRGHKGPNLSGRTPLLA